MKNNVLTKQGMMDEASVLEPAVGLDSYNTSSFTFRCFHFPQNPAETTRLLWFTGTASLPTYKTY